MGTDLLSDIGREIDARLRELRPFVDEYEDLLLALGALSTDGSAPVERSGGRRTRRRGSANGKASASGKAPVSGKASAKGKAPASGKAPAGRRPSIGDQAREAIVGALEHGSHTVAELAVVTAMSVTSLNSSLRQLAADGLVAKTQREGKAAWSLPARTEG